MSQTRLTLEVEALALNCLETVEVIRDGYKKNDDTGTNTSTLKGALCNFFTGL